MSEGVVRRAVDAFMARDLDSILALADDDIVLRSLLTGVFPDWRPAPRPAATLDEDGAVVLGLDVTATGAGSGVPIDQTYWLGARVRADKITFFGFFRTEEDALDAVT